jgi:hypothetical protein
MLDYFRLHQSFTTNQHRQCIDTHHEQTYNQSSCSCKSRTGNTDMSLKCVLRYSWPWVILTIASSSKPHIPGSFTIDYMLDYFRLHKSFTTNQHRQCFNTHHEQIYNQSSCSCQSRTGNTDMCLKCVLRYSWPWVILTIASSSKPHIPGSFRLFQTTSIIYNQSTSSMYRYASWTDIQPIELFM